MSKKRPMQSPPLHERYDRSHPLLRELVSVHVNSNDGARFDVLLTRVPCIGEAIEHAGKYYCVLRVFHTPVDDDGRAYIGYHAMIDANYWPEENLPPANWERQRRLKNLPF